MKLIITVVIVCFLVMGMSQERADSKTHDYQALMPSGEPAVGAVITLLRSDSEPKFLVADQDGQFSIEASKIQTVVVDMPGCAIGVWNSIFLSNEKLQLVEEYQVSGRVVDEKGNALKNALSVVTILGINTYSPTRINSLDDIQVPVLSCRNRAEADYWPVVIQVND